MDNANLSVEWIDFGREPVCPPDRRFPEGIVVDPSKPGEQTCRVDLPYPAKRCGCYIVKCSVCQIRVCLTTAGRPDDPRALIVPCKIGAN